MANHSYVKSPTPMTGNAAEQLLQAVVQDLWGGRLLVKVIPGSPPDRLSWDVYLPNSSMPDQWAMVLWEAPLWEASENGYGFLVWYHLQEDSWEFRHPFNSWERWAQDKVQHTIARRMGVETYQDDELRDTFRQYVTRNFKEPYRAEDLEWLERYMASAPKGFRE